MSASLGAPKKTKFGAWVMSPLGARDATLPVIEDVDSPLADGDTAKTVAGRHFLPPSGKVVITETSDYKNATNKVEQTVTNWTDTEITFTVDQGDIPDGTAYLWVIEKHGYRSREPAEITLESQTETFIAELSVSAMVSRTPPDACGHTGLGFHCTIEFSPPPSFNTYPNSAFKLVGDTSGHEVFFNAGGNPPPANSGLATWCDPSEGIFAAANLPSGSLNLYYFPISQGCDIDKVGWIQGETADLISLNNPPTVEITAPSNQSVHEEDDSIAFSGTASDVEDGDLTSDIVWSSNIDGAIGNGGSINVSDLSVGNHVITATVVDNDPAQALQGQDQISIEVREQTPDVTITSPADSSTHTEGDDIDFAGSASDEQDGDLTSSLTWTSDQDGQIGTGGSFTRNDLSVNTHTITAEVTDSDSYTGNDSISITVEEASTGDTPVVEITNPSDQDSFASDTEINFTGTATDTEDGDLSSSISWSAVRQSDNFFESMGTGSSINFTLDDGTWTISAIVTDSDSNTGGDQIEITVG